MPKFSKYTQGKNEAAQKPFVIEFDKEDGRSDIVLPVPDGDVIMRSEECATTRQFLRVMCADQYDAVAELIKDMDPEGLIEFVRDIARHYGIAPEQVPEGKARR